MVEVESIFSMVNFSTYFISEFSGKTASLQALTMKNAKFTWSNKCQQVFTTIKNVLFHAPVMAYFNPNRQTKFIVDRSTKTGHFGVLPQLDTEMQQDQVVHYDSRSTTPHFYLFILFNFIFIFNLFHVDNKIEHIY